jgi:hypothetical protein
MSYSSKPDLSLREKATRGTPMSLERMVKSPVARMASRRYAAWAAQLSMIDLYPCAHHTHNESHAHAHSRASQGHTVESKPAHTGGKGHKQSCIGRTAQGKRSS